MNETHKADVTSWVESANSPETDFPLQNLPFGVFRPKGSGGRGRVGVALGDRIIDVAGLHQLLPFEGRAAAGAQACGAPSLNRFLSLGSESWSTLRGALFERFRAESKLDQSLLQQMLPLQSGAEMLLPIEIGDYTDFYTSVHHATNVGSMFRPDNPLLPNFKHLPIAYHGRSSSVVVSGTPVWRPQGQTKADDARDPVFGPTRLLDYELEIGMVIGPGNARGAPIPVGSAHSHIFGLCLLNDWSARDIQKWEYQPLGPFLAKNFATTISPWIVSLEALEPFRGALPARPVGDPAPLPYLSSPDDQARGAFEITLEVSLSTHQMRNRGIPAQMLSTGSFSDMYWTIAQMVTHHTSNGCNLRPGDLLGSGTVSGAEKNSRGCLLELTWRGRDPLPLPTGETRSFLEDGDEVSIRGVCVKSGFRRIGFGRCTGTVIATDGRTR